jgi:hypothetical protein
MLKNKLTPLYKRDKDDPLPTLDINLLFGLGNGMSGLSLTLLGIPHGYNAIEDRS